MDSEKEYPPPTHTQTVMELFSDLEEKEAAREVGIPGVRVQTGRQLRDPAWYSGDRSSANYKTSGEGIECMSYSCRRMPAPSTPRTYTYEQHST